jgi:hypothetical protein
MDWRIYNEIWALCCGFQYTNTNFEKGFSISDWSDQTNKRKQIIAWLIEGTFFLIINEELLPLHFALWFKSLCSLSLSLSHLFHSITSLRYYSIQWHFDKWKVKAHFYSFFEEETQFCIFFLLKAFLCLIKKSRLLLSLSVLGGFNAAFWEDVRIEMKWCM